MSKKIVIVYVAGLGDTDLTVRERALGLWKYHGVKTSICSMDWSVDEPWKRKLARLSQHIIDLANPNTSITLVGESAGATAVTQAFATNRGLVDGVVLLCGKTQHPELLGEHYTSKHPALMDAVVGSAEAISKLSSSQKQQILNLHPIFDPVVPVWETKIPGVKNSILPMIGHASSIAFAITIWSWRIVRHAKKCASRVQ